MNYYKFLSAQAIIKKYIFLFSIHTPIISPIEFNLYKIFLIPILNQTIAISNPFILLTKNDYWTTKEKCPQIENTFICKQNILAQDEDCLYKLLTTTKNECPLATVYYKKTSIQRLNGEEILVIPFEETIIQSKCQQGIHKITEPSIITIPNCPIDIEKKIFEKEKKTEFQYVMQLPKFSYTNLNSSIPNLQLEEVVLEEVDRAQKMLSGVELHLTETSKPTTYLEIISTIILVFAVISAITYGTWNILRRQKKKKNPKNPETQIPLRKTKSPMFSELEEGGDM